MRYETLDDGSVSQHTPLIGGRDTGDRTPPYVVRRLICLSWAVCMCNITFGYDVGAVSETLTSIQGAFGLSDLMAGTFTGALNLAAAVGALLVSGSTLDVLGRKGTLLVASILLIIGGVTVASATNTYALMTGRAVQGLGIGTCWCASTTYITEVTPAAWRGSLVSISDISINFGILVGYAVGYGVGNATNWRVVMALSAVPPCIFLLVSFWVPETPRWLAMRGEDDKALKVLSQFTHADDHATAERVLEEICEERRALLANNNISDATWAETLSNAPPLATALAVAQQITGTEAILYYASYIIPGDPSTQFIANLGIGGCKFFFELCAAPLADSEGNYGGRRNLMILGNGVVVAALVSLAGALYFGDSVIASVALVSLAMAGFSLGPGPFTFVLVNEIVPFRYRGKGVAMAVACNRIVSGTVALTFLVFEDAIGVPAVFLFYAMLGLVSTALYYKMADTRGASLESLERAGWTRGAL